METGIDRCPIVVFSWRTAIPVSLSLSQVLRFNFSFYIFFTFSLPFFIFFYFFLVFYWTHKTVKKRTHRYRSAVTFPFFFFLADSLAIIYWWVLLIRAETASARRRNRGSIRNTDSFPSKFPWVLDPVDARQQFRSTTITDGLFI